MIFNRNTKKMLNKKGTYILEASIIVPAFVMVMALLISVISAISSGEKALFIMGEELKIANIKSAFTEEAISLPLIVKNRVERDSNQIDSVKIVDYGYLYEDMGIDDLISISIRLDHTGLNPLGKLSLFCVEQRVMSRAFTGLDRTGDHGEHALTGYEISKIVYVFPNRGTRYHNRNCPFLNPACEKVFLNSDVKSRFKACEACHSNSASKGDVVFCFFTDGKVYHLGSCSQVDKYYVEMERRDAEARGYSACASCGG